MNTQTANPGYTLKCTNCMNVFRCESVRFPLAGLPNHCPYCGQETVKRSLDSDQDYWYSLAESLDLPRTKAGAKMAFQIFDSWEPADHPKFADYVKALRSGEYDA